MLQESYKISRIQETKKLLTDADSSTNTNKILLVVQNLPKPVFILRNNFTPFMRIFFYKSITIPHKFLIFKKFGHWTLGSRGKKTVKQSEKVWRTDRQTNIRTFWLIESISPQGWCFENPASMAKIPQKNKHFLRGDFTPFMSKSFQIWDHFFPLHFPKDSENLKKISIWLWETGAKRCFNRVNKSKKIIKKTFSGGNFFSLNEQKFFLFFI